MLQTEEHETSPLYDRFLLTSAINARCYLYSQRASYKHHPCPQKPPFSENYFCDNMPKLKLTNRSEHQCIPYSFTKVSKISILQWHAKKPETSRGDLWKLTMPKGLFGVKKGLKWRRLEGNELIDGIIFYWALIMKVDRFAIIPRVIHWGIILFTY